MPPSKPVVKRTRGDTIELSLDTPWDLTGYTLTAQLRDQNGDGTLKGTFTTSVTTNPQTNLPGRILLSLPAATTEALMPGAADLCFDVKLFSPGGKVTHTPKCWLQIADRTTP